MQLSASEASFPPPLTLIAGSLSEAADNFVALARGLGVATRVVDPRSEPDLRGALSGAAGASQAVVVDFAGVVKATPTAIDAVIDALRSSEVDVLFLVTSVDEDVSRHLAAATGASVTAVFRKALSENSVCRFSGAESAELSGFALPRASSPGFCLSVDGERFEPIASIDGYASFGRVVGTERSGRIYVWSTPNVFDVRHPLDGEIELELAADEYLPAMMFLRWTLRERCWHTSEASAAVIVDDPLLRPRYGALDFEQVLVSARQHRYHVTLAFIPWNYWRTRRQHAAFFATHGDVFSVCAHGNDHTAGEFLSNDFPDLCIKLSEAQARFEAHQARAAGVSHEWLMVWPQERYSVAALKALAENGRFAAVSNTRCIPDDPAARGKLRGVDLLMPVADAWFGMPILKRHYLSEGMAKFALALFLGRPAILATHHQFFKEGTSRIEEFVAATRRLNPEVVWQPLTRVLQRLCWQRRIAEGQWEVRFFSDDFELPPLDGHRCVMSRRIPSGANVEAVTVNGKLVDFAVDEGVLRLESAVEPSGTRVKVHVAQQNTMRQRTMSGVYRARVAIRRIGSELRDRFAPGAIEG